MLGGSNVGRANKERGCKEIACKEEAARKLILESIFGVCFLRIKWLARDSLVGAENQSRRVENAMEAAATLNCSDGLSDSRDHLFQT
jgi:hypothetical protein